MKLKSFKILNYKSVIDSGDCRLSDNDNVLILAGQNESGKSSILQALYDYERGQLGEEAVRLFDRKEHYPVINCTFKLDSEDDNEEFMTSELTGIPDEIIKFFKKRKEITFVRAFSSETKSSLRFDDGTNEALDSILTNVKEEEAEANTAESTTTEAAPTAAATASPATPAAKVEPADVVTEDSNDKESFDITSNPIEQLARALFRYTPKIIFFDDFCDLLPKKMTIADLTNKNKDAKGYNAVKNIETILDCDLTELDTLSDQRSAQKQGEINKTLTANFNERWKQKIFEKNVVQVEVQHKQGGAKETGPYLNFFILTKEGEYLTPAQRSQGLKWFLSFYLELTAESESSRDLIILFDEPGLFLHSKAQKDIKNLFEELAQKDQIIFSTHSPYLIDPDKLNRVRLIINDENAGTLVEKISTNRGDGKKVDALRPIIDAMGMEVANYFTPADKKNVIVEGISDFYYLMAMRKVLNKGDGYSILPSQGANNVHLLMELCIGWGLEWAIVMDEDQQSKDAYKRIADKFKEEAENKIHRIKDCTGIEEVFAQADLKLVDSRLTFPSGRKNSEVIRGNGGKELFARQFLELVNRGQIDENALSKKCKDNFNSIFGFINKQFTDEQ